MSRHRLQHSLESPSADSRFPPHPRYRHPGPHYGFRGGEKPHYEYQDPPQHQSEQGDHQSRSYQEQHSLSTPHQAQPHPLAGLMMGGNVASSHEYYRPTSPRTIGQSHEREGWVERPQEVDPLAFETWDGQSNVTREDYELEEGWSSPEERPQPQWHSTERRGQGDWPNRGSEQQGRGRYQYQGDFQHHRNPYPSPQEYTADLPALPHLQFHSAQSNFGSPPLAPTSFGPSSVPTAQYIPPPHPTSHYSSHSLSLSAPNSRPYPSFSSLADFASHTSNPIERYNQQSQPRQQQRDPRTSNAHHSASAHGFPSTGDQGPLLGAMLDDHQSPSSSGAQSPEFPDYVEFNQAMSISPRSPGDDHGLLLADSPSTSPPLDQMMPSYPIPWPNEQRLPLPSSAHRRPEVKPTPKRKRGTITKEVDPVSGRVISPITGLPTKVISKRGWPPKDLAKRSYTCPFESCDRIFGRPSARETHIRSHNGVQPFICPISSCGRPFSVFSNLKRHMIVHPTVDFRGVSVGDLPHIHCKETEVGAILVWDDEVEQEERMQAER